MTQVTTDNRIRNIIIALAAVILSAALFFGLQTQTNSTSLEAQAEQSIPIETALANGKPTLTEFYANWCTSCQAMAPEIAEIKKQYGNSVNFVMLNVDNNKWLPEILRYRVDGIPHFVYLNKGGKAIAQTIGEQPKSIIEANLNALIADSTLPYASSTGQTSNFNLGSTENADPRSHGAQVVSE
ncbi:thiol:disulfide interchange protein [Aphanothece hegewaldii CCALA 016]|uniref:Thiol:disulfide interchange protein n=1 Tax=Aphanothece hegewaldii CCALA 016 TaxID=2107694 RepID=A0A2T1M0K5_9CHRO|nr:thioredoxin family protein [Aphanothece hegewaldii]PSF38135.1 thiol:disulfide interchange protein [Aphanothece hegewaldii CCALA 016]